MEKLVTIKISAMPANDEGYLDKHEDFNKLLEEGWKINEKINCQHIGTHLFMTFKLGKSF